MKSAPRPETVALPFRRTAPDTFELLNRFGEARLRVDDSRAFLIMSDGRAEELDDVGAVAVLTSLLTSHAAAPSVALRRVPPTPPLSSEEIERRRQQLRKAEAEWSPPPYPLSNEEIERRRQEQLRKAEEWARKDRA